MPYPLLVHQGIGSWIPQQKKEICTAYAYQNVVQNKTFCHYTLCVLLSRWDCKAQGSASLHSGREIQDGAGHKMGGWSRGRGALRHHPGDPGQVQLWLLCARRYSVSWFRDFTQTAKVQLFCRVTDFGCHLPTQVVSHVGFFFFYRGFRWYNTNRGWKRHIWGGEEVGEVQVSFLCRSVQKTKIAVTLDILNLGLCAFAGSVWEPREFQPQIWWAGCYWWPKHTTATL